MLSTLYVVGDDWDCDTIVDEENHVTRTIGTWHSHQGLWVTLTTVA